MKKIKKIFSAFRKWFFSLAVALMLFGNFGKANFPSEEIQSNSQVELYSTGNNAAYPNPFDDDTDMN